MPATKIGTVESIAFTSGGAGNQWTTIDGVRYATYWDCRQGAGKDIKVGATVEYRTSLEALWSGQTKIPHADVLRVIPRAA